MNGIPSIACAPTSKSFVLPAIKALKGLNHVLYEILTQIRELSEQRPEYSSVRSMSGAGEVLAPLLIAEVGKHGNNAHGRP